MINKIYLILICILLFVSCKQQNSSNEGNNQKTDNLDWLVGSWTRTNDKANKQTFEHWSKSSNSEYIGLGITLEESDTTFMENLKIVHNGQNWVYEVRGVNENMTPFEFTEINDSSFTCENEKNEFPKKIIYKINSDTLKAIISAGEVSIEFNFVRNII